MKKILLLLAIIFSVSSLCSCEKIFGDKDKDEDEENSELVTYFNLEPRLFSGTRVPIGISVREESYELLFGDTPIPVIDEQTSQSSQQIDIPKGMKGRYEVFVRAKEQKVKVGEAVIYEYLSKVMPGVAFKADLSDANSLAGVFIEDQDLALGANENTIKTFKTPKNGSEAVPVKFYNCQGVEVPGGFLRINNLNKDYFAAMLWNPSSLDQVSYNDNDFTAQAYTSTNDMVTVFVHKKTGAIFRMSGNSGEYIDIYSSMASFQYMGENNFCVLKDSYGSEFSVNKLYRFTLPPSDFDLSSIEFDKNDNQFTFSVSLEKVPNQDNVDIINGFEHHWLAVDWGTVLFNKDRAISGGALITPSFPSFGLCRDYFVHYPTKSIYTTKYEGNSMSINSIVGNGLYNLQSDCSCTYEIYQYEDHTFLRAVARNVGDVLHDITMTSNNVTVKDYIATDKDFYRDGANNEFKFPFYGEYDYYVSVDKNLYRYKVEGRGTDQLVYKPKGSEIIYHTCASTNGFVFMIQDNGKFTLCNVDASGNISQRFELAQAEPNAFIGWDHGTVCRLD